MSRVLTGLTAATLAMSALGAAQAADYGVYDPKFKPAYPADWAEPSPLGFEVGMRYFYGMGGHRLSTGGSSYALDDQNHILELHLRIDDHSTSTYLKGNMGYAGIINGTYNTPLSGGPTATNDGRVAYAGADFGYTPFDSGGFRAGGFVGYQYLNESTFMGRTNFVNASGGGNSEVNDMSIHALRLGVTAKADLGPKVDFNVDAAIIPYAALSGVYGAFYRAPFNAGGVDWVQGGAGAISGSLYGGAIDAMVGFHATENLTVRAGARAYYLTGPVRMEYNARDVLDASSESGWVQQSTNFEMFRWGPVVELTASF